MNLAFCGSAFVSFLVELSSLYTEALGWDDMDRGTILVETWHIRAPDQYNDRIKKYFRYYREQYGPGKWDKASPVKGV